MEFESKRHSEKVDEMATDESEIRLPSKLKGGGM
jgi:hypothetical protein